MFRLVLLLMVCSSCGDAPDPSPFRDEVISGRERTGVVYHALVPPSWERKDPPAGQDLHDTTLPVCSFHVGKEVLITVHTFPSESVNERIPPMAQIERWKKKAKNFNVQQVAHGGFGGYRLEAPGIIAFSMQLTPILYRSLSENGKRFLDLRADYTIKAIGPADEIEEHKTEIDSFAESFELLEALPEPNR